VRETTDSSDPVRLPAKLPRSTEIESTSDGDGGRRGSQAAARTEAEAAYQAEFVKAMADRSDAPPDVTYVEDVHPRQAAIYDQVRKDLGDTARIAENTGIPQDKLDQIKEHVFHKQHELVTGQAESRRGNFTPDPYIADLWPKAGAGRLEGDDAQRFHRIMAHEYVESSLMNAGMSYRSSHPEAWDPEYGCIATPEHFGAHDLASHTSIFKDPFEHWETRLGRVKPGVTEIAPDLSNLDGVIDQIIRGSSDVK
jgi:hypothetical protein